MGLYIARFSSYCNLFHRSLCAYLAAANHFTVDHLKKPEVRALMEKAQYYYMSVSNFPLTDVHDMYWDKVNSTLAILW